MPCAGRRSRGHMEGPEGLAELRLPSHAVSRADRTAGPTGSHRRWTVGRWASLHETGDLPVLGERGSRTCHFLGHVACASPPARRPRDQSGLLGAVCTAADAPADPCTPSQGSRPTPTAHLPRRAQDPMRAQCSPQIHIWDVHQGARKGHPQRTPLPVPASPNTRASLKLGPGHHGRCGHHGTSIPFLWGPRTT